LKDIEGRVDIDLLMRMFYEQALADDLIGSIFTDVANLDLEAHLPIIGDFWEALLFRSSAYGESGRNPMEVHRLLHLRSKFEGRHFSRWLELFRHAVDENFAGTRADFIKMRAAAIAHRFQENLGIAEVNSEGDVQAEPSNR
jgi:hemoglobin